MQHPLLQMSSLGALVLVAAPAGAQLALETLELPGGAPTDGFGSGMALDGDTLLVGAPAGTVMEPGPGFVVVYQRDDGGTALDPTDDTWTEAGPRIEASDGLLGEKFGFAVALEGDTAVVGAYHRPWNGQYGSVYFYERNRAGTPDDFSDDVWVEVGRKDSGGLNYWFGYAVAIEDDSVYIGEPASTALFYNGAVYVYERDDQGTPERFDDVWVQGAKLVSGNPTNSDAFGAALALQGSTLWVGAPNYLTSHGKAEVFERDTLGTQTRLDDVWYRTALVRPLVPEKYAHFGTSIALVGDTALVGHPRSPFSTVKGRVEVFVRNDEATPGDPLDDTWVQTDSLEGSLTQFNHDQLGTHLSTSGQRVLVGAPGVVSPFLPGRAYVFERYDHGTPGYEGDDTWYETQRLTPDVDPDDTFGARVLLDGELALVGAPALGNDGSGTVHLYALTDPAAPLRSDLTFVPVPDGGVQTLELDAGTGHAGRSYLVLGSAGGTEPAFNLNGLTVPLVPDPYMTVTVQAANTNGLENTLGTLDAEGRATARIHISMGTNLDLAGLPLHHAFVLFTPQLDFVSNAVPLQLVPADMLVADVSTISVASGGAQEFSLRAGASSGGSTYFVLGSITGTSPGFELNGFNVPLNVDFYTSITFAEHNGPLLENTFAALDGVGNATARFALPAGLTAAAGLELHHAFVLFDAVSGAPSLASNPVALTLIP